MEKKKLCINKGECKDQKKFDEIKYCNLGEDIECKYKLYNSLIKIPENKILCRSTEGNCKNKITNSIFKDYVYCKLPINQCGFQDTLDHLDFNYSENENGEVEIMNKHEAKLENEYNCEKKQEDKKDECPICNDKGCSNQTNSKKALEKPESIANRLISERQLSGNRMGINDDICNTNLISKNYSPMFIRKFNSGHLGNWPLYVSMICDEDVSDIDMVVNGALNAFNNTGLIGNNLQNMRNLTGIISETLSKYYNNKKENCVEGIAITLYVDKAYIQNFCGDYMNHAQCRAEYTSALLMMTQI